ncbi:TetR/AcrR family transcriptional regulator [Cryobacterium melibiosiphilum]|uniref:TetR/AcrR family transcriptional regulator n=1 Tax=Cryobacterium melibiosiphilum TaxID=995039 RepID=UPI001F41A450|nr:TetR/AcrR family transcriptional regulator [Cryobacterium melibiosiphilum]
MPETTTPTTRESKHQATALRVERNAVRLVLRHGFDNVTVDMICEASEISQRTFFNYFKTKDAAVIGADVPHVDEAKAREFISSDSDLLAELLTLMMTMAANLNFDEKLMTDRIIVFGQNPDLMHKQMERMTRVTAEVTELVYLRIRRAAGQPPVEQAGVEPAVLEQDLRDQAELLTNAIMGVLRFVATRWIPTPDSAAMPGASGSSEGQVAPSREQVLEHALSLLRRTLRTP